tara:strand:- start:686 stop:1255 length:570 start_codon:yes stop_codon:yes gene_type:complete
MKTTKLKTNKLNYFDTLKVIHHEIFSDNRGYLYESWNRRKFNDELHDCDFCQENHSFSKKNVLRGLHFQIKPYAQAKLVECIFGKVIDIVVDLRKESPTFLEWGAIELSDQNHIQILIPEGFAHGFYTLSETAHLIYKVNNYWHKKSERTIIWNDFNLSIDWKLENEPILSEKDSLGKSINEILVEDLF